MKLYLVNGDGTEVRDIAVGTSLTGLAVHKIEITADDRKALIDVAGQVWLLDLVRLRLQAPR